MALYDVRVTRAYRGFPTSGTPELSAQSIASLVPGSTVQSITALADGYALAIELRRSDHQAAIAEIMAATGQLGFVVLDAAITEFADSLLEGAAFGAAGGAAMGAATKSAVGFLLFFVGGFAVGSLVGSTQKRVKARYIATRPYPGVDWQFTALDLEPPTTQPQPI